nr:DUF6548 family protein [uncultured Solibaculum sp.]
MGFMNSYKRLDNLCRDMNGIGITGYIKDMETSVNGAYYIPGWKEDYLQLKQYRHIRNRIAHENDVDEFDVCSAQDGIWLETFYHRIMTQNDPLALYYKATKLHAVGKAPAPKIHQDSPNMPNTNKSARKSAGCATLLLLIAIVTLIMFKLS